MTEPRTELNHLLAIVKARADGDGKPLERRWELLEEVEKLLPPFVKGGKIEKWNGHLLNGSDWHKEGWFRSAEERLKDILESLMMRLYSEDLLEKFHAALTAGVLLDEPILLPRSSREFECPYCAERLRLAFNGKGFELASDPCEFPDGLITEFELNVPSGKIVVDDDLRQWFPVEEDYNVNAHLGCHLSSLAAAKVGMAYGFVGNTSPGVFKKGDRLVVGNYREEIYDEEDNCIENPEPCPWGEKVASICTDLWWYSIADYDEFERRHKHYTPDKPLKETLEFWTFNVVDVKPGVYKFRQEQGVDRDEQTVLYATFEWVRDPNPVVDYLGAEKTKNYNATEVLIQEWIDHIAMWEDAKGSKKKVDFIARWNEMTEEEKAQSLAHPADRVMFSTRADDWHEKGFPRMPISDEAKQLAAEFGEVRSFDSLKGWSNPSEDFDAICLGAGLGKSSFGPFPDLAHSFILLGMNICQNAIKFGEAPRLSHNLYPPAFEVPFCRERMATFVKVYRAYRKKYPDLVFDAEFDAWMTETNLEKHVAEFDFGPEHPPKEDWGDPPPTVKSGDYFEFDGTDLHNGDIALHPVFGTQSAMGHLHADHNGRGPGVPLKVVGRVLRGTGDGYFSKNLVVAFDYGTKNMTTKEWMIDEQYAKGLRQFNDQAEYLSLLETHKTEFAKTVADKAAKATKKKATKKKATKKRSKKVTKKKS